MRAGAFVAVARRGRARAASLPVETALAFFAVMVGLVGIASALTPELARRSEIVDAILPPGLPTAGRLIAIGFALTLLWLARGLAARKKRAWKLAVVLLPGMALAHLVKGLDFEEAVLSLALFAALVRSRRRFDAPGDPMTLLPLGATTAVLGLAALPLVVAVFTDDPLPERVHELLWAVVALVSARALHLWLRPWGARRRASAAERGHARAIVAAHGDDSLAFFALRHDKRYFFSRDRTAFLAYRVVAGCALIGGDPIGRTSEFPELLARFREFTRFHGWRLGVLGASDAHLELFSSFGLRAVKLGDEAIVRASAFSLEGRPIRKVRQSVTRAERAGYRIEILREGELSPSLREELEDVSREWLGNAPERGFAMAMDSMFGDPETTFVVARHPETGAGALLHLVPSSSGRGFSLSAMRRRRDAPNGLTEYLIASTLAWMRANGVEELSLNFCAFADALRAERGDALPLRLARRPMQALDGMFQLERLLSFNQKFFPEWRPRYLLFERVTDVPRVGIACLLAESLLTVPSGLAQGQRGRTATA
jgi:lysyl-tRNA synthetase class 2